MFIVCRDCQAQYDVGEMVPGAKFLCRCGLYVRVPEVTVKDAVVTRCPSCGAALGANAKACTYCGSEISLAELSLGEACPKCFSRMFRGAKFCSTCGLSIRPEKVAPAAELDPCPRCEEKTLVTRPVREGNLTECTRCGGIWLGQELFRRVVEERDERAMAAFGGGSRGEPTRRPVSGGAAAVRYLACPRCGERMHRRNFGRASGVIIDWCKGHGYWFDPFEIERIFEFVRTGGLDEARRREIEEARETLNRTRDLRRSAGSAPLEPFGSTGPDSYLGDWNTTNDVLDTIAEGIFGFFRRLFGR